MSMTDEMFQGHLGIMEKDMTLDKRKEHIKENVRKHVRNKANTLFYHHEGWYWFDLDWVHCRGPFRTYVAATLSLGAYLKKAIVTPYPKGLQPKYKFT